MHPKGSMGTLAYTRLTQSVLGIIYGCGSKLWLSLRPLPLCYKPFVAGPLLQTLAADLCVEYCSLQGACRGGVCRRTPLSVANLCREMAAQACYKANVFDSLPYVRNSQSFCNEVLAHIRRETHLFKRCDLSPRSQRLKR